MTDLPFTRSSSETDTRRIAAVFARLIAALSRAGHTDGTGRVRRRLSRRTSDEVLMARARREDARRRQAVAVIIPVCRCREDCVPSCPACRVR